jgi:hypothetical protein
MIRAGAGEGATNMSEEENMMDVLMDSAGDRIAQRMRSGLGVKESDLARVAKYERVQSGDLITAEWMNRLLRRLALLELFVRHARPAGGGAGDPFSVFGKPLSDAVRIIIAAGNDFSLGKVLDVYGMVVQTTAPGTGARIVIGQFFVSEDSTGVTTVNLLVTANATGGFFRELGSDAKDIIAKVVYQAVETQIAKIIRGNKRNIDLTHDTAETSTDRNAQPMHTIIASKPAAAADEGAAAATSSSKRRAGKKAAKGGRKAAGSDDAGGNK